jgi:polyvinyl alcohol dehydrogenase (cytochrome)
VVVQFREGPTRRLVCSWLTLIVLCASVSCSSSGTVHKSAGTTTSGSATNTASNAWPLYGHDLANGRAALAETEIDTDSVSSLTPTWSKSGMVGVTGTPVVANGTAYFGDWTGNVYAVSALTGALAWKTPLPGGVVVGSPAISGRRIFVGIGQTLYALDRSNGQQLWHTIVNANSFSQINASPVTIGDIVLQGVAQFEEVVGKAPFTFKGSIGAFDASTGKQLWNFFTTPNDATSGAGQGVWSTPAVDPRLGLLYVGDGQSLNPPTGPLADSILAINYKTGKLVWSHQFNHPDVFSTADFSGKDADVGASPNLWTSHGHDMVGVGSKNGTYYAFDRSTGKLRWETFLAPGSTFGGALGSAAVIDGRIIASSNIGDPSTNATTNNSLVDSLDPSTGHVEWTHHFSGNVFGPVSAVHGVAFVGTDTGQMAALNITDGKVLWTFAAPDKVGGGASIVNGRVLWGYGFTLFKGPGLGGIIDFSISAAGRVHTERGGQVATSGTSG